MRPDFGTISQQLQAIANVSSCEDRMTVSMLSAGGLSPPPSGPAASTSPNTRKSSLNPSPLKEGVNAAPQTDEWKSIAKTGELERSKSHASAFSGCSRLSIVSSAQDEQSECDEDESYLAETLRLHKSPVPARRVSRLSTTDDATGYTEMHDAYIPVPGEPIPDGYTAMAYTKMGKPLYSPSPSGAETRHGSIEVSIRHAMDRARQMATPSPIQKQAMIISTEGVQDDVYEDAWASQEAAASGRRHSLVNMPKAVELQVQHHLSPFVILFALC